MNILFLTSGQNVPASRFRVLNYVPYLESQGHRCTVRPSRPEKYVGLRFLGNRLSQPVRVANRFVNVLAEAVRPHDVVFLEREILSSSSLFVERLFRRVSRRLVLDVDDAIFLLHPRKFERLASMADCVIVGNRLLEIEAAKWNPRVVVVPTVVDAERYKPRTLRESGEDGATTIGWIGTSYNYRFLEPVADALNRAAAGRPVALTLVAERPPPASLLDALRLPVRYVPWTASGEAEAVAAFDVGIMPLADDDWCRYKCGAKLLQYMAAGLPAVASPVGVNAEIVQHGVNGFLAATPNEWAASLKQLIGDREKRFAVGAAARETVERDYSVARWAPLLESTLAAG